jgi:predicted dehydrogenase
VRVVQIGAGSWGSSWARIIATAPDFELAALVDRDRHRLDDVGDLVRVPVRRRFGSLADALERVEVDAALVVVAPAEHLAIVNEGLAAGLHCLVEKPFALGLTEARDTVERAERAGLTLMVNQDQRFTRGARTLQRLVSEQALGAPGRISVRFARVPALRPYHADLGDSLLVDMAIHHFDQLRALGLAIERVWAHTFAPAWSTLPGNAAAEAWLEAPGLLAAYSASWAPRGRETSWSGQWEVECERGVIFWDGERRIELAPFAPERMRRAPRTRRVRLDPSAGEGLEGSLLEFASAVESGREPETSGRDNLATLALVLAAAEASACGAPVEPRQP